MVDLPVFFTIATSIFWFRETVTRLELAGAMVIVLAILALVAGA